MCRRYVHRIFCTFGNEKDAENLFEFLSCRHKNIKFTLEKKVINFDHFLMLLSKMKETVSFSVYRKKTSIGFLTH